MDLRTFLEIETAKPFAWGETDCCAMADRWVSLRAGFSPLDRYGRRHRCRADAIAWIDDDARYLARAVLAVMRHAELKRTRNPQPGDVGLVRIRNMLVMAICSGRLWVGRDVNGFMAASSNGLARAWRVPCREQ
ncbi:MAG: hypothetical protein MnENMB40S_13250 [Rhizobiaceae bacterium MnEN-MB40S]|nr:MAG: hypothetical protein MnENMB40S_13250 [Rhizobiaceae bacterium MnEN-MB40S]